MGKIPFRRNRRSNGYYPTLVRFADFLALSAVGLAGCATTGDEVSGAMQVTLKPGATGNCDTSPCEVSFEMPPGSGTYEVTGNETKIGDFPAGQTVSLGNFWQSNAIKVVGANVPPAYVYVPAQD